MTKRPTRTSDHASRLCSMSTSGIGLQVSAILAALLCCSLLATNVHAQGCNLSGGKLTAYGGNGDDRISIWQDGSVIHVSVQEIIPPVLNSNPTSHSGQFAASAVTSICLRGSEGDDVISVLTTQDNKDTDIECGPGDDTVYISPDKERVSSVGLSLQMIDGGTGNDTLEIFDTESAQSRFTVWCDHVISAATVAAGQAPPAQGLIPYNNFENLTIRNSDAGPLANQVGIESSLASVTTRIQGGSGTDEFHVRARAGGFQTLKDIKGPVWVYGNGGVDTLTVDDFDANTNAPYTVNGSAVHRDSHVVYYKQFDGDVNVNVGTGSNTVMIPWTTATVDLWVDGGNGDDKFQVGSNLSLAWIRSGVYIYGGNGYDRIQMMDQSNTDPGTYTFFDSVMQTQTGFVKYPQATGSNNVDIEEVELSTTIFTDTLFVSPPLLAPTYVDGVLIN